MNKQITFIIVVLFAFAQGVFAQTGDWNDYRDTSWGSDYSASSFTISTVAEMAQFAYMVNTNTDYSFAGKTVTLDADIDLSAHYWEPIGDFDHYLAGTFDGAGHTISGFAINPTCEKPLIGIFGLVKEGGHVTSLKLENSTIYLNRQDSFATSTYGEVGGIVGRVRGENSSIENCLVENTVTIHLAYTPYETDIFDMGGVVGENYMSNVIGCMSKASVTIANDARVLWVGGVVGYNDRGTIRHCMYLGSTLQATYAYRKGAITGRCDNGTIDHNFYFGDFEGVGRITGTPTDNSGAVQTYPANGHGVFDFDYGAPDFYNTSDINAYDGGILHNNKYYHAPGTVHYSHKAVYRYETSVVKKVSNGQTILVTNGNSVSNANFTMPAEEVDLSYVDILYSLPQPTDVTVTPYCTHATVSWTADGASAWQIMLNGDVFHDYVEVTSNPFDLTDLVQGQEYTLIMRIKDGSTYSIWSDEVSFTTDVCNEPENFNTEFVGPTFATLSWDSDNDVEMRYGEGIGAIVENFESEGMNDWTTIDANNTGYTWIRATESTLGDDLDHAHSGTHVMYSACYDLNGASLDVFALDDYLVSPQVNLGGTISFWVCGHKTGYWKEKFSVAVSTTVNNDAAAFTDIRTWNLVDYQDLGEKTWIKLTADLGDYSGEGYVAIHHYGTALYENYSLLYVDDINIVQPLEGSWTNISDTLSSPYTLSSLTEGTTYTAQVRTACSGNEHSDWVSTVFTTLTTSTITMNIKARGDGDGWYFIASPVASEIAATTVTNLINEATPENYDFYRFNQAAAPLEWENYKSHQFNDSHYHFNLENGRGYLYANVNDVTLSFNGLFNENTSQKVPLQIGWNLVGNPFAVPAYYIDGYRYYELNSTGSDIVVVYDFNYRYPIPACTGIFIETTIPNDTITFSTTIPEERTASYNGSLQITLMKVENKRGSSTGSGTEVHDNAIVSFNEGAEIGKFIFNKNHAKIYFPKDGKDYAIAYSNKQGEMPLNFKATEDGNYTLSFTNEEVNFSYLHLIDNLTGADVDLLHPSVVIAGEDPQSPMSSYTFNAKTTDYASRFRLVFSVSGDVDGDDAPFAFLSNGNIIINGEGTLQVIDMTGRVILSGDAINRVSTDGMTAGVYVLRLINGDDVKTQKIVVR